MISTVCAWVLVVLAASPVTAPFSTCDLRAFFTPTPIGAITVSPGATLAAPLPLDGDANGVSPIVARHDARSDTPGALLIFPFSADFTAAREVDRPDDVGAPAHDRPARPLVLRL